jgi:hypothetical protein
MGRFAAVYRDLHPVTRLARTLICIKIFVLPIRFLFAYND